MMIKDLKSCAKVLMKHHDVGCAGLAANQVGYDKRVFVVITRKGFIPFVNPSFEPCKNSRLVQMSEGCLSFPGKVFKVSRYTKIYARSGEGKRVLLKGKSAQAFQHELNHLDGILI
jgi:peptide deformylase